MQVAQKQDDTNYLLSTPKNSSRLLKAINNIENHKANLIHKSLEDFNSNIFSKTSKLLASKKSTL